MVSEGSIFMYTREARTHDLLLFLELKKSRKGEGGKGVCVCVCGEGSRLCAWNSQQASNVTSHVSPD